MAAVLEAGGALPEHVARMTWYVTDMEEYKAHTRELGAVYREVMGNNYPTMSLFQVTALLENDAMVEIEATAVIPRAE